LPSSFRRTVAHAHAFVTAPLIPRSLVVYSRQLPLPVHFTEEVFESQPRVVHLPILSRTDEALHIAIASLPNSGILHHLLDVPQSLVRDIDTVQGRAPSEALPGAGVLQDIQAPLKYCDSSALSDTRILSAAGDVSWPLLSLAHDLHQASCTPLPGDGFLARICRAYLNGSSVCAVFPNATCTCAPALTQLTTASGRSVQCLGPEYSAHTTPLSDIRVRASASYLIIAALLGHASSVTWLLSVGAVRHELAMQVAAGAGNSEIVGLLLSGKSPWNDRALAAARLRGHIDVILTLDAARLRALAGEHNGYVSSARAMVTDAMDRCFVRGPAFASITGMGEASGGVGGPVGSIGVVHDPEMRVLFVPTRYDPSSPLIFHFQVRMSACPIFLSSCLYCPCVRACPCGFQSLHALGRYGRGSPPYMRLCASMQRACASCACAVLSAQHATVVRTSQPLRAQDRQFVCMRVALNREGLMRAGKSHRQLGGE
jgi:hypothetical protein